MSLSPAWARSIGPLVLADLRHRYAGSVLGALWAVLGPFVEVLAYALLFSLLLRPQTPGQGLSYALFIASGLLPWTSAREALEGCAAVPSDNRWIRRSRVPLELLVARQVLVAASRGAVGLGLVLVAATLLGLSRGWGLLLPLVGFSLQTAATYGMGLALAPLGTLHPDLRPALTSVLTLLTFASPILYPESVLDDRLHRILEWNPFTHLLRFYRAPLAALEGMPGGADVSWALATPVVLVGVGVLVKDRLWWGARDRL